MITCIVAMDEQGGIGLNGALPWHIKADLQHFKKLTLNHTILMGKTTFLSIGKALPERKNLVVTHYPAMLNNFANIQIVCDLDSFLRNNEKSDEMIYIIGGANVYAQALPFAKYLAISHIKGTFICDTFFPHFDLSNYQINDIREFDDFVFKLYERIK